MLVMKKNLIVIFLTFHIPVRIFKWLVFCWVPIDSGIEKYRIGMNGDALIKLAEKRCLTIPLDAISKRDGKVFVSVKADNQEQKEEREIKVGLESEDEIEVLEGLSENDQVVLPE
jgi:multidrug efflux pump subunit AcrA (membrane-fusion protein)